MNGSELSKSKFSYTIINKRLPAVIGGINSITAGQISLNGQAGAEPGLQVPHAVPCCCVVLLFGNFT